MKITVYYEDKTHATTLEVPDADCEIWVETDYQQRLAAAEDKSAVTRRSPQEIMDEECNKPTFNSHQRETRRHASLEQVDLDGCFLVGAEDVETDLLKENYEELNRAIAGLSPQQQELIRKIFRDEMKQADIAREEGVHWTAIEGRLRRIYARLRSSMKK